MKLVVFLAFVTLLGCTFMHRAEAIECYSCSNEDCTKSPLAVVQCSSVYDSCMKVTVSAKPYRKLEEGREYYELGQVSKLCATTSSVVEDTEDACAYERAVGGGYTEVCLCSTNRCNGATSTMATSAISVATVVATGMAVFRAMCQ